MFLAADLGIKRVQAIGHLTALWHAVMEQQEDGNLEDWTEDMISEAAMWEGDANLFLVSLQARRFLDGKVVHDWLDYAWKYLHAKYHSSNKRKLKEIRQIHKVALISPKVSPKGQKKGRVEARFTGRLGKVGKGKGSSSEEEAKTPQWPCPKLLIEKYNTETPNELSAVEKITPARIAKANTYLKIFPQVEFWTETFAEIHKSQFLRGLRSSNGHGSFKADFDWLLTQGKDGTENAAKVWEGKYRDGA